MPEIERNGEELPRLSPGVGCDSTAQGNKVKNAGKNTFVLHSPVTESTYTRIRRYSKQVTEQLYPQQAEHKCVHKGHRNGNKVIRQAMGVI